MSEPNGVVNPVPSRGLVSINIPLPTAPDTCPTRRPRVLLSSLGHRRSSSPATPPAAMAEESPYSNKRKLDDTPPLFTARRPTGFSSGPPIASPSPPPDSNLGNGSGGGGAAYPSDEIQLAKQRAQEIAARLFSSAEAKRPRVENGGSDDGSEKGFGSGPVGEFLVFRFLWFFFLSFVLFTC